MSWQGAVETTVKGLGYELVDAERSAGGLLRVSIDHPEQAAGAAAGADPAHAETPMAGAGAAGAPAASAAPSADGGFAPTPARFITVEDCERVTRQLQHVLEVEGCDYQRLEVSSPGLDRPLKRLADYRRFAGEQVELTLKLPFEGRKKFRGELQPLGEGWRLVLPPGGGADATQRALDFDYAEVREARLVPVVDFKGRGARGPAAAPDDIAAEKNPARAPSQTRSAGEIKGGRTQ